MYQPETNVRNPFCIPGQTNKSLKVIFTDHAKFKLWTYDIPERIGRMMVKTATNEKLGKKLKKYKQKKYGGNKNIYYLYHSGLIFTAKCELNEIIVITITHKTDWLLTNK